MAENFMVGCDVTIHSLVSRPELNGEHGVVVSTPDTASGRYAVKVDGQAPGSKPLLIKRDNLHGMPDEAGTPLMQAVMSGNYKAVEMVFSMMIGVTDWVDRPNPNLRITPLMACAFHDDEASAVKVACRLLKAGAHVETPDATIGSRPAWMAAQEGRPKLLRLLINQGARIDLPGSRNTSSTPIVIASQNGHAECVAVLIEAGLRQGLRLTEVVNPDGKTPALIATERGHATVLGVLAQGGADLRLSIPACYSQVNANDEHIADNFDPSDDFPLHRALDLTVQSHVKKMCCHCGIDKQIAKVIRCPKCKLAYFCSDSCLKVAWKTHKLACKPIKAGRELLGGSHNPTPQPTAAGFEEPFGPLDEIANPDAFNAYNREDSAKWQYDAGSRGQPDWRRYPARIEENLESMCFMDFGFGPAPKYMYRPGHPECDGCYERHGRSTVPPPSVSTRYITFDDMTERDVYSGASRAVRRNGVRSWRRPRDSEDAA